MIPRTREGLDALTDQAIAHLLKEQRKQDALTQVQVASAKSLAAMFLTQFGDDAELAGRVVVSASQAISQLVREMRGKVPDYQLAPVVANVLAFAGEQVVRKGTKRGETA